MSYDFVIIGGGIVGVSTAWQLQQRMPGKKILVLEKESGFARHQTGHNSGVIHAGVYYKPGSLKAKFCKQGMQATIAFCQQEKIPFIQCGKLLVATNNFEFERMEALYKRCQENEIDVEWLTQEQLKEREPNVVGIGAIYVKATGIVNFSLVTEKMARRFMDLGGEVILETRVTGLKETSDDVFINTEKGQFSTKFLITCSGLMSDRTVKMLGIKTDFRIVPFRGEYFRLPDAKSKIVNHLIYPIPDPDLPFLGVHLTRMIDGSVTVGPNAVLGLSREGYPRFSINLRDCWDMFSFKGFWVVVLGHLKFAVHELKNSLFRPGYLKEVRKYCPQVELSDLGPYPAGIRAQAVMLDGTLVHDFLFAESPRSLHVCNAPSPAATSAMPIGNYICDMISQKLT
ncbi:MAG: L-2-hydroxyglutarate oxidase [Gammaproteobacteria bacterium]|nr:L-2-hydroxyglutarate oxidase [Gammaproteobacteria bacterium]